MTVVKKVALGACSQPNKSKAKAGLLDNNWKKTLLPIKATVQEAITRLDQAAMQIVMVINEKNELYGTITDGDIRRGLLNGLKLDSPVEGVIQREAFVVPESMENEIILKIMSANSIRQIPIIDNKRKVVGLHTWENLAVKTELSNPMIIMAGGKGKRLHPFTEKCP